MCVLRSNTAHSCVLTSDRSHHLSSRRSSTGALVLPCCQRQNRNGPVQGWMWNGPSSGRAQPQLCRLARTMCLRAPAVLPLRCKFYWSKAAAALTPSRITPRCCREPQTTPAPWGSGAFLGCQPCSPPCRTLNSSMGRVGAGEEPLSLGE